MSFIQFAPPRSVLHVQCAGAELFNLLSLGYHSHEHNIYLFHQVPEISVGFIIRIYHDARSP